MGELLFTQNISDGEFIVLPEVAKRENKSELEIVRIIIENKIPLYIYVKPKNKERAPKFVPLEIDEIKDLYANKEFEITVRIDRLVGICANDGNTPEDVLPLRFDHSLIIFEGKIEIHQTLIRACDEEKISIPMPVQLRILTEVWRDVFSNGLIPMNPPKTRKEYALDYLKTKHPYIDIPQRGRLATMATGDTSGKKVTEPVTTSKQSNEIDHELYSRELAATLDAWINGMPDISNAPDTDKSTAIVEYLNGKWPQLSGEAIKRIKFVITT